MLVASSCWPRAHRAYMAFRTKTRKSSRQTYIRAARTRCGLWPRRALRARKYSTSSTVINVFMLFLTCLLSFCHFPSRKCNKNKRLSALSIDMTYAAIGLPTRAAVHSILCTNSYNEVADARSYVAGMKISSYSIVRNYQASDERLTNGPAEKKK